MRENSLAAVSKEEVQALYQEFLQVLKSGDLASLERMYADDYLLVRPNGVTLGKQEILADLRHHSMKFTSFEVNDLLIRIKGCVGILTADVRSTAVRDGVEIKTRAMQLAILSKENERITISHFQSTNIVDPSLTEIPRRGVFPLANEKCTVAWSDLVTGSDQLNDATVPRPARGSLPCKKPATKCDC
jgi:ketosteroid isomerase-like protein